MHVGFRTAAVAAVCSLCVGAGVDARTVPNSPSVNPTATTRSVTTRATSLTSLSGLLATIPTSSAVAPAAEPTAAEPVPGALTTVLSQLSPTSPVANSVVAPVIPTSAISDISDGLAAAAGDYEPPDFPPFPSPAYFANLAFAVFHVAILPIAVPVQLLIGNPNEAPALVERAFGDLGALLGQLSPPAAAPEPAPTAAKVEAPGTAPVAPEPTTLEEPEEPAPPPFPSPAYFANLAFAVMHVIALPITVPVQALIGDPRLAPGMIVKAFDDLNKLLTQLPKPPAVAAPEAPADTQKTGVSEKPDVAKHDVKAKDGKASGTTPKDEVKPAAETPAETHEPAVEHPKVVEPKVDPVEHEAETPQEAKPAASNPVKVIRDSLRSTPGETGTTGGTKATEGTHGTETKSTETKGPLSSTISKIHKGLKSGLGGKTEKPAEKPSTDKSTPSEGSSHASEGASHSSSTE